MVAAEGGYIELADIFLLGMYSIWLIVAYPAIEGIEHNNARFREKLVRLGLVIN